MEFQETETIELKSTRETNADSFEAMRSPVQELTFAATKNEFDLRHMAFGELQMQTLKLISSDGLFTNLGLLLSEQCPHTIKVATFSGTDQEAFMDRREFSGSLLKQMNDVYDYIDIRNQVKATFERLLRIEQRDYPEVAVREALLNALVHRDYSYQASTLISIYTDRIEFVTLGGLLPGIELNDLDLGISVCRNPMLANLFYRLQLIEAYGTGIRKIKKAYVGMMKQPQIEASSNAFRIVLPNTNLTAGIVEKPGGIVDVPRVYNPPIENVKSPEDKILQHVRSNQYITRKQVQEMLGMAQSPAGRLLARMVEQKQLVKVGNSRNIHYVLGSRYI